jgi:large subunit ribosomal protein L18
MIKKIDKNKARLKRSLRIQVVGTPERPRLNVYRSLGNIYAQIIDDTKGHTLVSASTLSKEVADQILGKTKQEAAFIVGQEVAKLALSKGITKVVFDRAGYIYTGRIKALADGARNAGLEF